MADTPTNLVTTDRPEVASIATVRPLPWYWMLGVRVLRTYLQTLIGLTAIFLVIPSEIPAPVQASFVLGPIVVKFVVAAQWALVPAFVALLHNLYEIVSKLDINRPELRA